MRFLFEATALDGLTLEEITLAFGAKAAGFITIPAPWRPTAHFISRDAYLAWSSQKSFVLADLKALQDDLSSARAQLGSDVILRSSATDETVNERGQHKSERVDLTDVRAATRVLESIFAEYAAASQGHMCVIAQSYVDAKTTGFLSNELRLVDKPYRWIVEQRFDGSSVVRTERISAKQGADFPPDEPLVCLTRSELYSRLRSAARYFWRLRDHRDLLEWCWDERHLWLLQRDDASPTAGGHLPNELGRAPPVIPQFQDGQTFKRFEVGTSTPWRKLGNVIDFSTGGAVPPHRLYFAVAKAVESSIENAPEDLAAEIDQLTGGRAVIRCDTLESGFNFPRTHTISGSQAVDWLSRQLEALRLKGNSNADLAFIMHSHIPARAAAWSYFRRGDRTVHVDGLWGLADGMQYYPCDTYIATTDGKELSATVRFKELVLLEQADGSWRTDLIDGRFARHRALSESEVSDIAARTSQIASSIDKDVQIMWFVDVPDEMGLGQNLPWFKVTPEQLVEERQPAPLRAIRIRQLSDLRNLEHVPPGAAKVILEPEGEDLRSDDFIQGVAEACTKRQLPVELRGSVLSHAFHQLRAAGVEVFSAEPRKRLLEVRQRKTFQKLVRDHIPEFIEEKGESVNASQLNPQDLVIALLGKLFEEAAELAAAESNPEKREELADIFEIVRGIARSLGATVDDISAIADRKRAKRGGFELGVILRSTEKRVGEDSSPALFDLGVASRPKVSVESLPEVIRGNVISDIAIARLLKDGVREFRLTTGDLGSVLVRVGFSAGSVTVSVGMGRQELDDQQRLI